MRVSRVWVSVPRGEGRLLVRVSAWDWVWACVRPVVRTTARIRDWHAADANSQWWNRKKINQLLSTTHTTFPHTSFHMFLAQMEEMGFTSIAWLNSGIFFSCSWCYWESRLYLHFIWKLRMFDLMLAPAGTFIKQQIYQHLQVFTHKFILIQ